MEAFSQKRILNVAHSVFFVLCTLVTPLSAFAEPVTIPFTLVQSTDPNVPVDLKAPIEQRLAHALRRQLDDIGFAVNEAGILGVMDVPAFAETLASFCAVPLPKEIETAAAEAHVTLDTSSQVILDLDDLRDMRVGLALNGAIHTTVPARVTWGQAVPFVGNCEKVGTDSGTIDVDLPFELVMELQLGLGLGYDEIAVALVLDKQAKLTGGLAFGSGSVTPEFGNVSLTEAVINAFEDYLLGSLRRAGEERVLQRVQVLNFRLDGLDENGSPAPGRTPFNGRSTFPVVDDTGDAAVARALLAELALPQRLIELLNSRAGELVLQLLGAGPTERKALLTAILVEVGCDGLVAAYGRPLARAPLFALQGTACSEIDANAAPAGTYYTDAVCSQAVAFRSTPDSSFCAARFVPESERTLGNAAAWIPDSDQPNDPSPSYPSRAWTAFLSNRLALGVVAVDSNYQPYVKQINYKTIDVPKPGTGPCKLEMRVYKKDVGATDLRPLLAIHGGTWRNRGFSFLGLEAGISHFTERGFVVFAPFYRLVGDGDGNPECNGASWAEVIEDVEDALKWTVENGTAFGASGGVRVFGQSAGAHLALWLATHESASVDRALVYYPPVDTLDFLQGAIPLGGRYGAFRDFGFDALAKYYGASGGSNEVRLQRVEVASIDSGNPPANLVLTIPNDVFDLSASNLASPPTYLRRCAAAAAIDLRSIDPANPPADLIACLKQDLSDFLLQNAFLHQIRSAGVPFNVVHGSSDSLVPFDQAVALCNAVDGGSRRPGAVGERVSYQCGSRSRASIVTGAEHALDLGLCIGTVCPAGEPGTPLRSATENTLRESYDWLARGGAIPLEPSPQPPAPASGEAISSSGGGGAMNIFWLCAMALLAVRLRRWGQKNRLS